MHLTPAEYASKVFGSQKNLAKAIGRCPSGISHWNMPRSRKGMDGFIPRIAQQLILAVAKRRRLDITADDLIHGREV